MPKQNEPQPLPDFIGDKEAITQCEPQPLDDKELREKIEIILGESHYGSEAYERYRQRLSQPDDWRNFQLIIDQLLALLQPKIEEAKAGIFNGTLIFHIPDKKTLEEVGEWAECQDIGTFVYFTREQWQALKGGE